ncbi:MAG: restriction endonuclease subunit S [Bryobacterales bacterium]|nr:restriction endonuclease subunit S [Bryobacterales bacterium]
MTVTASTFRDSGIEWLPKTPSHWEMKRLKFTARFFGGSTPSTDNAEFWDGDIPWVSPKDMRTPRITDSEDHITKAALASSACRLVPKDAVLIVVRSGILRHSIPVAINRVEVALNQDMKAIIPMPCLRPEYLCHLITGLQRALLLEWRKQGATVESIEHALLANWMVPLPPVEEQERITRFLDDRCARIDEIIAKKQRLIELLEEQKAALITRAVTRGLDPSVPIKDSGIPLLGEIPLYWNAKRLKYAVPGITVGIVVTPAKYYADSGVPCLRSLNISSGSIDADDLVFISPESNALHAKSRIHEGDVVVVRTGKTGAAAVVSPDYDGANCIDLLIIRRSKQIESKFLWYVLNSRVSLVQIEAGSEGAIQAHYNTATLAELRLVIPPLEEQGAIVRRLDAVTSRIDSVVATTERQIVALGDYRSALITAAVTGQLDVITAA